MRYIVGSLLVLLTGQIISQIAGQSMIDSAHAKSDEGASRQEIRFYKANRALQTDRIWFTKKKARVQGCHDFIKKTRVFKVVQFGYQQCTLYSKKECAEGSEISARHSKSETPETLITQGYGWLPVSEHKRGAKLRSWSCE